MIRSRALKAAAIAAAALAIAAMAVVTRPSHEDDEAPPGARLVTGEGPGPGLSVAMPAGRVGLEVMLGLKDDRPTEWEGDVKVSSGRVVAVEVERAGPNAKIEGDHFSIETVPTQQKQVAVLRVTLEAPEEAVVTVATTRGGFEAKLSDLTRGRTRTFLDGQATVARGDAAVRLTGSETEDDFPAIAKGPDGSIWLVYVAYRPEQPRPLGEVGPEDFGLLTPSKNGDQILLRRYDPKAQAWQPAIEVTGPRREVWRPAVAVDGRGAVHVAWAQPVDGDWEIVRRTFNPADGPGAWSDIVRVTDAPGSDFHVVAATDAAGTVWLAWQGWREDNYEILAAPVKEGEKAAPRAVSESPANDWGPAIAADGKGNVYVAWDTYDKGNYDVRLRNVAKDEPGRAVADSPRFEGRPHLACDKLGRVWVAYEEGDEQWGKDYAHAGNVNDVGLKENPGFALYVNRTVRVRCWAEDRLMRPTGALDGVLESIGGRNESVPRLTFDDDGGLWLFYRHYALDWPGGEIWVGSATRYDGRKWSPLRSLAASSYLIDDRPALAAVEGGVVAVHVGDRRVATQNRDQNDLYATRLASEGTAARDLALDPAPEPAGSAVAPVHLREREDVARIRAYRVEHGGKSLRLLRGEFHRHTEYTSHNDIDGLLEDAWRYALDAGRLDWMGDGDHDNGFGHEYFWWTIQKTADLHLHPPHFVAAQTYERSVNFPNGHRNVMMPRRGIRPLPRGGLPGTAEGGSPDTKLLYQYLKHFGGICASHTSATTGGTDWRDNDPELEPVVEIFQGHRHNYERPGAPRAPTAETQIDGFEPAGFISNALVRGYRLGFQSSSDHVSTHMSYAVVLTDDVSRPGLIEAFKKRHCYAATDNIILDVRSGEHLMGDAFETRERPTLEIAVQGTSPVARVHVIRDDKYVFSTEPGEAAVKLRYADDDARPGQSHYYYVRVEQADGNLAWASPLWISYKE